MSLKSIIEHFSSDAKMKKYEEILHTMVDASFELRGSIAKGTSPHIYISLARGANINTVKEIYAKVGIKLQQRMLKIGNGYIPVLCMAMSDFNRLSEKHRDFFKRTTNADKIKR